MPSGSSSSVVVKSVDKGAVRRAMDAYASVLLTRPEVEEVVVFGSFERDTYAPGSDLDVLVVLRESPLQIRDRPAEYSPTHFPVPMDLFAFTRPELESRRNSPLAQAFDTSRWRYRRESVHLQPDTERITQGIREFMARDWDTVRDAKDTYWRDRVGRLGAIEAFRIAGELRNQALAADASWPEMADRAADLSSHARLAERFRRADAARRR